MIDNIPTTQRRVFVLLYDSFGIGAGPDAAKYGDKDSDTLGHIVEACANGQADIVGVRSGSLQIPQLISLGLARSHFQSTGKTHEDLPQSVSPEGIYGYAVENSLGKDTPSGHWEIAGVPVMFEWGYFGDKENSFPESLLAAFIDQTGVPGILGNCHASGTDIIDQLADEHRTSGKPIVYTSADSVFQIAADEDTFGLDNLYRICEIARELVDPYKIGRVIARPFRKSEKGDYYRTANRRDYSTPPPEPTLLEKLKNADRDVIAIGKTADIFAHRGMTQTIQADGNQALFDETYKQLSHAPAGSLIFTNFVDFDSKYGHRRNTAGYANALEMMDKNIALFREAMLPGDIAIITADHGCDPTAPGSDHTREHIPVLVFGPEIEPASIGRRESFADIGQSIAAYLGIDPLSAGKNFFNVKEVK